jgi:hypothetical protein
MDLKTKKPLYQYDLSGFDRINTAAVAPSGRISNFFLGDLGKFSDYP